MAAFGGGGGKVSDLKGFHCLRVPSQYGIFLQIPGESNIGGGSCLGGSDSKYDEGAGSLAENVEDPDQGGGEAVGVRIFL